MLPANLNKFIEYLDENTEYNPEDQEKILQIFENKHLRTKFYSITEKTKNLVKGKPFIYPDMKENVIVVKCFVHTDEEQKRAYEKIKEASKSVEA